MKYYKKTIVLLLISVLFLLGSCLKNTNKTDTQYSIDKLSILEKTKTQKLAEVIFKNENTIHAAVVPKIITATEIYHALDQNILLIDIRKAKDFANGHIKNAVNIKMSEILDYAQVTGLPMYDKVVIVCYTGQTASYSSAILNMLGYNNIYVLEWGMCSWNKKFSGRWNKNSTDNGIEKLITKTSQKNSPSSLPLIVSTKNSGYEILQTRARALLKESFANSTVNFKFAESNAKVDKAYVICYQPESVYKSGHIVNAIHYNQKNSFNLSTDLLTLPTDKTIVIYSDKAYQSTYIMVYLKMLGYKAKTLKYGAISFMNSKLIELGTGFSTHKINNYPFETSKYIEVKGEVQEGGC